MEATARGPAAIVVVQFTGECGMARSPVSERRTVMCWQLYLHAWFAYDVFSRTDILHHRHFIRSLLGVQTSSTNTMYDPQTISTARGVTAVDDSVPVCHVPANADIDTPCLLAVLVRRCHWCEPVVMGSRASTPYHPQLCCPEKRNRLREQHKVEAHVQLCVHTIT